MPQGTIRDYDQRAGMGTLLMDDRTEVHIDPASMEGSDIRLLRIGQRVKFELILEGDRKLARALRLVTL